MNLLVCLCYVLVRGRSSSRSITICEFVAQCTISLPKVIHSSVATCMQKMPRQQLGVECEERCVLLIGISSFDVDGCVKPQAKLWSNIFGGKERKISGSLTTRFRLEQSPSREMRSKRGLASLPPPVFGCDRVVNCALGTTQRCGCTITLPERAMRARRNLLQVLRLLWPKKAPSWFRASRHVARRLPHACLWIFLSKQEQS